MENDMKNTSEKSLLETIKEVLANELKDSLGHTPSQDEYLSCLAYLDGLGSELRYLAQIGLAIIDWRDEYCDKCLSCGDWFLSEEMTKTNDGEGKVCGPSCEADYEESCRWEAEAAAELQDRWNE